MPIEKSFKKIFLDEEFALLSSSYPGKELLMNRVLSFTGRLDAEFLKQPKAKLLFQ